MTTEDTNEMTSEVTTVNPWQVDSVQAFVCLKCPECTFDAKKGEIFRDHALENHPLSFVLFGKTLNEEGDFGPSLNASIDFTLDTNGIKQEFFDRKHPELDPGLNPGNVKKDKKYVDSTVKQEYNDFSYFEHGRVCERMSCEGFKKIVYICRYPS